MISSHSGHTPQNLYDHVTDVHRVHYVTLQTTTPPGERGTCATDLILFAPPFLPLVVRRGVGAEDLCLQRSCSNWRRRRIVRCARFRFLTALHSALNGIRTWNVGCFRISKWGAATVDLVHRTGMGISAGRQCRGVIHFHTERTGSRMAFCDHVAGFV